MRAIAVALVLLLGAGASTSVSAQSAPNRCTVSATPLQFGGYNPLLSADVRSTATITYNCTTSRPITISVKFAGKADPDFLLMHDGASPLKYEVYLDAAATAVWGDGANGSQLYRDPAPPPNQNVSVPVFGRVPARQQGAHNGAYGDMLIVQINY